MRTRGFLAALALPLALVTACGGDSGTTAEDPAATGTSPSSTAGASSASPSAAPGPQCTDVWVVDGKLPGGYDGCYRGDKRVRANGRYCEFGKPLMTYDETFYSVPGGRIAKAHKPFGRDQGYQDVLAKCSG